MDIWYICGVVDIGRKIFRFATDQKSEAERWVLSHPGYTIYWEVENLLTTEERYDLYDHKEPYKLLCVYDVGSVMPAAIVSTEEQARAWMACHPYETGTPWMIVPVSEAARRTWLKETAPELLDFDDFD